VRTFRVVGGCAILPTLRGAAAGLGYSVVFKPLDQPAAAILERAHLVVDETRCVVDFERVEDRARLRVDCVGGCIGQGEMAQFGL
jgi:hypothetical protein